MDVPARYSDGTVAVAHDVVARINAAFIEIVDAGGHRLATWPSADVFPLHGRRNELRMGVAGQPYGARLVFTGYEAARAVRQALPALAEKRRLDDGRQLRLVGLATLALASVLVAYLYGVPLVAARMTGLIPTEWEQQFGDEVARQIEASLSDEGDFQVCDPDPGSLANRAIARFATAALADGRSPFLPDVQVVRSSIPNAFALPGGKAFYFSALLDVTESQDEFAGVLAHELGHVARRHAMQQLISSAGTGLLIGFILGDMTGISVAGGLGAALIDSRFSREEEAEADRFAADNARRLGFRASALASLLERVAGDDEFTAALALLSTHPLTTERRRALEAVEAAEPASLFAPPAFSEEEWAAIKAMCAGSGNPGRTGPAAKRTDKNGAAD